MIEVFEQSDVSTSATDFQPDGTATPGTTGRLADAGHVHPKSSTGLTLQTVNSDPLIATFPDGSGDGLSVTDGNGTTITIDAPEGFVVIGTGIVPQNGGYLQIVSAANGGSTVIASDGTSVTFTGVLGGGVHDNTAVGYLYATCIGIA